METDRDRPVDTVWEGEGGRMERGTWKHMPYHMENRQPGNVLCDSGSPTQCSMITSRAGTGWEMEGRSKREGTNAYLWLIHVMYGRNEHNIVKQLSSNKKKKGCRNKGRKAALRKSRRAGSYGSYYLQS